MLVSSGAYLLIYLYRWEWNRAIISGIFFLGAEIALASSMILVRLRRLDERLSHGVETRPVRPETPTDGDKPFAWLDPTGGGFGVFVPVLMGAGFVLSAIAFVVEKLAGALSPSDSLHRGPGSTAALPPVPARGLVPSPGAIPVAPPPLTTRRRRSVVPNLVAAVVVALLGVTAIDVLADATQNRPDVERAGTTVVDLEISTKGGGAPTMSEAAEALWAACRALLPAHITRVSLTPVLPTRPDRQRLRLDGVVGQNARRRFVGCLEDATIDRSQARVIDFSTLPPPKPGVS